MILSVIKIFLPATLTFFIGILITPSLTHYFYKYKMWKHTCREENPVAMSESYKKIHDQVKEVGTPRVGGIIIWLSVLLTVCVIWIISLVFPSDFSEKINFLSRNQTILPLFALVFGSLIGLIDDLMQVFNRIHHGLSRNMMLLVVLTIGLVGALWFFFKLDYSSIAIPFNQTLELGWLFIPFFIFVVMATFSSGVIDGIDGLAGGVISSIFVAYTFIAFFNNQIDLAAFSAVVASGLLVFLWFNVPPARFYMGETGILGLTVTIAVIAFLTNTVLILPIIAFPLVATSLSSAIQIISKKYFKKKVFRVAPLHHHFEALGWPKEKVTMRFWILSVVFAIIGILIVLIS